MSNKVSVHQLQERLTELLDEVIKNGEECIVQCNGKDCAVLVSAQQWRRRTVGDRLDAIGPLYRLSRPKQRRAEQLLIAKQRRRLTAVEGRELRALLRECDEIMLRRARAVEQIS
jgi:prevent-host-death family protein